MGSVIKLLKTGTLNVRGIRSDENKENLANDMIKYDLQILAIQETHLSGTGTISIKTTDKMKTYDLFYTGTKENKHHGVGIVVDSVLKPCFVRINDRICLMKSKLKDGSKIFFISTYAHTLQNSERNPRVREEFYEELNHVIEMCPNKDTLIIGGDFNAKTGSGRGEYPESMGKYGKGEMNSNGRCLLDMAQQNFLLLTNTLFKHKMAHRTTWTCPERTNEHCDRNGNIRRNPYRNQIDYILVKKSHRLLLENSRSYSGINTDSDHRLVICTMNMDWYKIYQKKNLNSCIDYQKFRDPNNIHQYTVTTSENFHKNKNSESTVQERWNIVAAACEEAANTALGKIRKGGKSVNENIINLSKEQKKLRLDINSTKDKNKREELRKKRNKILNSIHKEVSKEQLQKIEELSKEIENTKNDSNRMYKAVSALKITEPKKRLIVEDLNRNGLVTNEEEQIKLISSHFENVFKCEGNNHQQSIPPTEMEKPFTSVEIGKAVKGLKNNKSAGCDNIKAELLKFAPSVIYEEIANILNIIAATGTYPKEIKQGILVPIPKPGKRQGPPSNLRPIILLSVLRKILAICMIRRISERVNNNIPVTQAAYRSGRSTTEMVFTMKILAEKAITSADYETFILLLDMSKAFDTVCRNTLLNDLRKILNRDELHMISMLIRDVELVVKCGKEKGAPFKTNIGVPQGDCLSPVLFTLYLAKALEQDKSEIEQEHNYSQIKIENEWMLPKHLEDHSYYQIATPRIHIDQQYADDIGYITSDANIIKHIKQTIPSKLQSRNLQVNKDKTEEYRIKRNDVEEWKKCKYLGSLLDTEKDISRRKGLATAAFNKLKYALMGKNPPIPLKINIFNAIVSSIFLYNSELWTLTKVLENRIDSFQRSMLRKILKIQWPRKISNIELYSRTKTSEWSADIRKRRINWLGHLLRLPEETPAQIALKEYQEKVKKPRGGQKITWLDNIKKDLKHSNLSFNHTDEIKELARDRVAWRRLKK